MRTSEHYNLNLVEGTDLVNPLTQDVPNYEAIDSAMYENQIAAVQGATELKTGTVHAITRADEGAEMFRFTATSNWTAGDTMTVDGAQVSVFLPSGEALGTGAYVVNSEVLCAIKGTRVTAFIPEGTVSLAADSEKLNGQSADFYATAENLRAVEAIATAGAELAQTANTVANAAKNVTDVIGGLISTSETEQLATTTQTGVATSIRKMHLTQGNWLVVFGVSFGANSTGYRTVGVSSTLNQDVATARYSACTGANTIITDVAYRQVGASGQDLYLQAKQNSGSNLSTTATSMYAIRIR